MRKDNVFQIGREVTGESFIGRKKETRDIANRVLTKGIYHSLSIVGLTRVGKSSIIKNAVKEHIANAHGVIYVKMVMSEYDNYIVFWKMLAECIQDQVETVFHIQDERMKNAFDRINKCTVSEDSFAVIDSGLSRIFLQLSQYDVTVLIILDEFDAARNLFKHKTTNFEFLRTVSSSADYTVSVILISRRSLYIIEECSLENSTFHGVFDVMTINVFNDEDMEEYYAMLSQYDITLDDMQKEKLNYYCGRIPYLLSIFGHDIVHQILNGEQFAIEEIFHNRYVMIREYYDDVKNQIIYDHFEDSLYFILGKEPDRCRAEDTSPLMAMGILSVIDGKYIAISQYFTETFLNLKVKNGGTPIYDYLKSNGTGMTSSIKVIGDGNIIGETINNTGSVSQKVETHMNEMKEMEKIAEALEQLKSEADNRDKEEIQYAITEAKQGNSKKVLSILKKLSGFLSATASNVAAEVIIAYMRANGIPI